MICINDEVDGRLKDCKMMYIDDEVDKKYSIAIVVVINLLYKNFKYIISRLLKQREKKSIVKI